MGEWGLALSDATYQMERNCQREFDLNINESNFCLLFFLLLVHITNAESILWAGRILKKVIKMYCAHVHNNNTYELEVSLDCTANLRTAWTI